MIGRLRLAAENHQGQHDAQPQCLPPTAAHEHPVRRQRGKRQPRRADQKHHVAVLEHDVPAAGIRQCRRARRELASLPMPREQIGSGCRQYDVSDHVQLVAEGEIQRQREHKLARIEEAAASVGQNRHAAVLLRVPEWHPAGGPFPRRPLKQRMVEMSRIPHGERAVGQQHPAEERGHGQENQKPNDETRMTNGEWRIVDAFIRHSSFEFRNSPPASRCR
jgi:hypothetical protein